MLWKTQAGTQTITDFLSVLLWVHFYRTMPINEKILIMQ